MGRWNGFRLSEVKNLIWISSQEMKLLEFCKILILLGDPRVTKSIILLQISYGKLSITYSSAGSNHPSKLRIQSAYYE